MIEVCPECGSGNVERIDFEEDYRQETEGNTIIHHYFICEEDNCGCEFTITEETTCKVEITKKGKGKF